MDTNRLHYFCVVARIGSLRQAAGVLGVSPPALSKALQQLAREVGFALLRPAGRGVVLTAQGRALAEKAEPHLHALAQLHRVMEVTREQTVPRLHISTFEAFSSYIVMDALTHELEGTAVTLIECIPGPLEKAVRDGRADIGLTYMPVPMAEVEHVKIASLDMAAFARADAPFFTSPRAEVPYAVPVWQLWGAPSRAQGLDGWPDAQWPRTVGHRVSLLASALELCRRGLTAAYLPRVVAALHNAVTIELCRLQPLPAASQPPRRALPVYLVKRPGEEESLPVRRLSKAVRRLSRRSTADTSSAYT
jgi:DNA-binding transcriptional LysR family regulator